jgi:hypothetical protein
MYQADFKCTYKLMDNENDQEDMYRIQLLQAFDLNEWDDDIINETIKELYNKLSHRAEFKEIFSKARENKSIIEMLEFLRLGGEERLEENDIIFNLLFKFEYYDLLHRCLIDYLILDRINPIHVRDLLNELL